MGALIGIRLGCAGMAFLQMQLNWSCQVHDRFRSFWLTHEPNQLIVWDGQQELASLDASGQIRWQKQLDSQTQKIALSANGRVLVQARGDGRITSVDCTTWQPVAEWHLEHLPKCLGLDAFGQHIVVATDKRWNYLFKVTGEEIARCQSARRWHHLCLLETQKQWIGVAEQGCIQLLNDHCQVLWQDISTYILGNLAITVDGHLWVATFGHGIRKINLNSGQASQINTPHPVALVASNCVNSHLWMVSEAALHETANLSLLHPDGRVLATITLANRPQCIQVAPSGDSLFLGWASGHIENWVLSAIQTK